MTRDPEETRKKKKRSEKTRKIPNPCVRNCQQNEEAEATSSDVDGAHSEEALAISVSLLGAKPGGKAMEDSLSAFASLPSAAEAKDSSDEKKNSSLSRRQRRQRQPLRWQ
jgi:hypothetical protein